jgi:hypothetical protein
MTTTTPDFRARCEELIEVLSKYQYRLEETYHPDATEATKEYEAGFRVLERARADLATPPGPPKNCWLDDEPDLCPSPCVFDDPSEVISNCTYAQTVKCKTDCQYYRVATPPPEPLANQIIFNAPPPEEVIRLDKEGFHYKGQFIADAGEAHRLMLVFLEQHAKVEQEPPTDEELMALAVAVFEDPYATDKDYARAVLERWGK